MDTIATAHLFRQGYSKGGITKQERHSVDFVINGNSLFTATHADKKDMCGRFSAETKNWNQESARAFLLEGDPDEGLDNQRFMVFVCSECGDLGCGAITCEISRDGDSVIWQHFAYENGYDPKMTDLDSYSHIGPFCFHEDEYRRVINEAQNTELSRGANALPRADHD